jgi:hypothetical protein
MRSSSKLRRFCKVINAAWRLRTSRAIPCATASTWTLKYSGASRSAERRRPAATAKGPAGVAEYHLMPGSRKERSELAAHQSRTENANSH